jgi:phenylpyruvate tautomerase PptA (4-oxalocrotonate tautomerase family)
MPFARIDLVRGISAERRQMIADVVYEAVVEPKKDFYKAVADVLHGRLGLRREDVFISVVEVAKENWSFGNGVAQYATRGAFPQPGRTRGRQPLPDGQF